MSSGIGVKQLICLLLALVLGACVSLPMGRLGRDLFSGETIGPDTEIDFFEDERFAYALLADGTFKISYFFDSEAEEIDIPSEFKGRPVTAISEYAFDGEYPVCVRITLPETIRRIDRNPFWFCRELEEVRVSPDNPCYASIDGVLFSKSDRRLVCFPAGHKAARYTVPDGVCAIGDMAFIYCGSLQEVVLPKSVTEIGRSAFCYCTNLGSITLPDTLTGIGANAFDGCSSLNSVTLPDTLTSIGDYAFGGCSSLNSVFIPSDVREVGDNPFLLCASLSNIRVSDRNPYLLMLDNFLCATEDMRLITFLPGSAETGSEVMSLPEGISVIGGGAFRNSTGLGRVILPESVVSIEDHAFDSSDLSEINLPDSLTEIGLDAFYRCENLGSLPPFTLTVPDSVRYIGDKAFESTAFHSVTLPKNLETVRPFLFYGCKALESVRLPEGLNSIEHFAFGHCASLKQIDLPQGLTEIKDFAFFGCKSLNSVSVPPSVTKIDSTAFRICSDDLIFTVGQGTYAREYCLEYGYAYTYPDSLDWVTK
ncbi:MAG: leucine-rich repeat domain-containing protein [Clostridia bacterium]|nr:leucine-rich repeat domain-containing protein [Clostridia bacterium]